MPRSPDIDFKRIAPRGDSQDAAFEEFCCQLALDDVPDPAALRRVRGAGGDGGVECLWTAPSGEVHGWQVKYIFDLGRALRKVASSLATARRNHPSLNRYVVCLPFDLSGSKGRSGRSEQEKFDEFKERQEAAAAADGQHLTIELWSAFRLRDRLLRADPSGGRARYWFDSVTLSAGWFSDRVEDAVRRAGPRYNPKLHTGHALDEALAALAGSRAWSSVLEQRREGIEEHVERWSRALASGKGSMSEPFPPSARAFGQEVLAGLRAAVELDSETGDHASALQGARAAREAAARCERVLAEDIDERFGAGQADSVPFRHFQAEYQCRFPAQHLDTCRELREPIAEMVAWLEAPAVRAAAERVLVLTGPAGIGKTHGLCDAAVRRQDEGLPTILVSGGQFGGGRTVWESLTAALGLDSTWSPDMLLDALNTAGATSGRLLICLDALDERPHRTRWLDEIPVLIAAVSRRPHLALCLAVRSGYLDQVLRSDLDLAVFEHPGFGGDVFDACSSFFRHFDLDPPVGPLLEPEYSNPLFLLVLCSALKARGLRSVPVGWSGARRVLGQLFAARDQQLQEKHPAIGNRVVTDALRVVADALQDGGPIAWSRADELVTACLPQSQRSNVALLDHLVGIGLLRVVPGEPDGWRRNEDGVDIAFGRLGHHLLAERLTSGAAPASDHELRARALDDPGLAHALALAMPELGRGELVDLAAEAGKRSELLDAWIAALPWRSASSLGPGVEALVLEALREADLEHAALDALLILAMRPGHPYDHRYLHAFLARPAMPLRDAGWCWFLHRSFERTAPPSPLVRVLRSPWESDLTGVQPDLREAWCVVLAWCGAAADLRVRDHATKAAVRVSESDPACWAAVIARFADIDDDAVVERVLCAAYGAALRNPVTEAVRELAAAVRDSVLLRAGGPPRHALVRDHARCIGELAAHQGALPKGSRIEEFRPPFDAPGEIEAPEAEALKRYDDQREYPQIFASVMSEWTGDFAKYTMPFALAGLESLIGKDVSRRWVMGQVIELGYAPRLHAPYDHEMIARYGHGRGRPGWAERIGKKYQRIALGRLIGSLDDIARAEGAAEPGLAGLHLRAIDPSIVARGLEFGDPGPASSRWWEPAVLDFSTHAELTDVEWVGADDFPDPAALVGALVDADHSRARWRLLEGHFSWSNRGPRRRERRYRDAWMMIKGYLVPRQLSAECFEELADADFMGRWMVEGFDLEGRCYLGEYPWAAPFPELREPAEAWQHEAERYARFKLQPTANRMVGLSDSWALDRVAVTLPTAPLLEATGTWWDGTSGFRRADGRLIFRDPSVTGGGPSGIWMDDEVLARVLEERELDLIWTVLAERRIIGDDHGDGFSGMKHASMVMQLDRGQVAVRRARGEHLHPDHTRTPT